MKTHGGVEEYLHAFPNRHQMEVNGQINEPVALPPGKESPVPTAQAAGWVSVCLDEVAKRNISKPCRESNPGHPARSLVATVNGLPGKIMCLRCRKH